MRRKLALVPILMTMMVPLIITRADALTKTFSTTLWGTVVTVPLDIDNESCIDDEGVFVCTALSEYANYNGKNSGGIPNSIYSISGQAVQETSPVPGTGCLIDEDIHGCTLNGVSDACEYTVDGGSFATQMSNVGTANILYGAFTGGTVCVDFLSLEDAKVHPNYIGGGVPTNFSATFTGTIVGGTGVFAGNTGSFTETNSGLYTSSDLQGHNFGWFTGSVSGTMTH
jgi:hypothetical protein